MIFTPIYTYIYKLWVEEHFVLKNQTRKIDKIHQKFLNYMMCSCIIFCAKMLEYSQIIYSLQEKSTHFGLEVSLVHIVLAHFEPKNQRKFIKIFELYQIFM